MAYEHRKHDGSLPVIGVNTFLAENESSETAPRPLSRGTEAERASQLARVRDFQLRHGEESVSALADLRQTAAGHGNVFAALMDAVRVCSLGQITEAFFDVGGRYRRSM